MRKLRHISFSFVLAALLTLVVHSVVPHHHHSGDAVICFATDHSHGHGECCPASYEGACGEADDHAAGDACALDLAFVPRTDVQGDDLQLVMPVEWLASVEIIRPAGFTTVSSFGEPADAGLPDEIFLSSLALRGPPVAA